MSSATNASMCSMTSFLDAVTALMANVMNGLRSAPDAFPDLSRLSAKIISSNLMAAPSAARAGTAVPGKITAKARIDAANPRNSLFLTSALLRQLVAGRDASRC
jgi:hypothetical protein